MVPVLQPVGNYFLGANSVKWSMLPAIDFNPGYAALF